MNSISELCLFPTKDQLMGTWDKAPIKVKSNHYSLAVEGEVKFCEWYMSFIDQADFGDYINDPTDAQEAVPQDSQTLIMEITKANSKEVREVLGSTFTSGVKLFTISKVPVDGIEYHFKSHPEFVMICRSVNKDLDFNQLVETLDERSQRRFVRYLNNHLERMMKNQNYKEWDRARGYFNMDEKVTLENHNLMVFNGFKSRFCIHDSGIKLLFDCTMRVVRFTNMWDDFISQEIKSDNHDQVCDFFIGKMCMANYANNRVYRIDDIDFMLNPMSPFPDKTYKNYEDYFMQKYGIAKLKFPEQFMLVHKSRVKSMAEDGRKVFKFETIYLIPELMLPVGLDKIVRDTSPLGEDLAQYKFKDPKKRFGEIDELITSMNDYQDEKANFKLKINQKTNIVTGYTLDFPKLRAGTSELNPSVKHLQVTELADGKKLTNWVVFYDYKHEEEHNIVIENVIKAGERYSLEISKPLSTILLPKNASVEHVDQILRKEKLNGGVHLIFFVVCRSTARFLYRKAKAFYNAKGIVTQFLTSFNPNKDVTGLTKFNNMLLQMIVKLGGTIWEVENDKENMMVAGADVFHPTDKISVASVVNQMGSNFNNFYSLTTRQAKGAIVMNNVFKMVIDSIKHYVKKNNVPPKNYLFFRSGVRRNEYDDLIEFEINRIVETLQAIYSDNAPKLTFVVVSTRVSDRFAIETDEGLKNPSGGLVVIDEVVEKDKANFFLISQQVTQGSACPTHYDIVYSEGGLKFEEVVEMAYSFTFGYSNWMGSLRVPSMIKNAQKLSKLIGITQDDTINDNLKEVLFFL